MRVEVGQLAGRLEEAHRAGGHLKKAGVGPELSGRRERKQIRGAESEAEADREDYEPDEIRRSRQVIDTAGRKPGFSWTEGRRESDMVDRLWKGAPV